MTVLELHETFTENLQDLGEYVKTIHLISQTNHPH